MDYPFSVMYSVMFSVILTYGLGLATLLWIALKMWEMTFEKLAVFFNVHEEIIDFLQWKYKKGKYRKGKYTEVYKSTLKKDVERVDDND